ncbi:MAG: NTP transferase domain-containing protein [Phycisphaerales bacterium]
MRPCNECAIVVLAAGRGTRMGGPKALMSVPSEAARALRSNEPPRPAVRPWWRVQHERLRPLGGELFWVVTSDVRDAMLATARDDIRFVIVEPGQPMFDSVLRGISAALGQELDPAGRDLAALATALTSRARGVFLLPVDVPAAEPRVWGALRATGEQAPVVPTCADGAASSRRGHPVFLPGAWIRTRFADAVRSGAASGLSAALDRLRLDQLIEPDRIECPVTDRSVITNLNTPADVASWARANVADRVQ